MSDLATKATSALKSTLGGSSTSANQPTSNTSSTGDDSSNTKDPSKKIPADYHNAWHGAPGDDGDRDHGIDPSTSVHPQKGSARAPEFLEDVAQRTKDKTGDSGETGGAE